MSGNTKPQTETPATRDEMRAAIFGAKPSTKEITFFGQKLELHQPSLGTVLDMRQEGMEMNGMKMLMDFAYVAEGPNKGEKIFEAADEESLRRLPFGPDVQNLMTAVANLLGVTAEGLDSLVKDALKRDADGGSNASADDESVSGAAPAGGGGEEVAAGQTA
jgi:hypothetical protein